MARIKYQLTALNPGNIVSGSLCVIASSSNLTTIYNINENGQSNSDFIGAGICNYRTPYYYIVVDSVSYTFDAAGKPISSNAVGCTLYSAVITNKTIAAGTVIPTNTSANQTKSVTEVGSTRASIPDSSSSTSPETSISYTDNASNVIAINQLNARDEFAAAALRGMLNHIDDPSTMSKNEMFYLCDTSYKWAENMMTAAANARAGYTAEGYNTDPMNSLIDAVDRDSQLGFTVAAGDGITVNSGQSASYPSNSTFNIALSTNYLNNALNSWKSTNNILSWSSLTTADDTHKIDASHLPNGTLTWSDLTNAGNSEKINISHLPEGILTWSNLSTYDNTPSHKVAGKYIDGTWWGQTMQTGNIVEGDIKNARHIYMSGNLDIVGQSGTSSTIGFSEPVTSPATPSYRTLIGVNSLTPPPGTAPENYAPAVYIGYGLRYERKLQLHGRKIEFIVQPNGAEDFTSGHLAMTILGRDNPGKEGYVGIGTGNPTSKLHVDGAVRIGNILLTSEGDNTLKISKFDGTAANVYATGGVSSILPSSNDDKKFYFDSTHYLHVENGVLKYFNGSTDKTVNLT